MSSWATKFDISLISNCWADDYALSDLQVQAAYYHYSALQDNLEHALNFNKFRLDLIRHFWEMDNNPRPILDTYEDLERDHFIENFFTMGGANLLDAICPNREVLFEGQGETISVAELVAAHNAEDPRLVPLPCSPDCTHDSLPDLDDDSPIFSIKKPRFKSTNPYSSIREQRATRSSGPLYGERVPPTRYQRKRHRRRGTCYQCGGSHKKMDCDLFKCYKCLNKAPGHKPNDCPKCMRCGVIDPNHMEELCTWTPSRIFFH